MKMRRIILLILSAAFVFVAATGAQVKKYDIKSGIVTYDMIMKVGDFEIKNKIIVYFDDYGMKECKETISKDKLEQSYFSDGKNIYSVKHKGKTAYKQGAAYRGTELRVEWSEFGTEKDRSSGICKKIPSMKIAEKNCEMIETNDGKGTVAKYGGWNKILLYMDVKTKDTETIQRALKVEENVKVSPDKFIVPAGYAIK